MKREMPSPLPIESYSTSIPGCSLWKSPIQDWNKGAANDEPPPRSSTPSSCACA